MGRHPSLIIRKKKGFPLKTWSCWIQQVHMHRHPGSRNSSLLHKMKETVTTKTMSCLCSGMREHHTCFSLEARNLQPGTNGQKNRPGGSGEILPIHYVIVWHWKLSLPSTSTNKAGLGFSRLWIMDHRAHSSSLRASQWCMHSRGGDVWTSTNFQSSDHS